MSPRPPSLPVSLRTLVDQVQAAAAARAPLQIRGSGSKDFYGGHCHGGLMDMRPHAGITQYDPTELVITARAGTPMADLNDALAQEGQYLPFDPPCFGPQSTVGGMVAAGLAGPARASVGGVRDYVLGATLLNGRGELLSFGGQVMKNVAGYDVSRLLAGSLGTLGLVTEVSLKVLPVPFDDATLRFALPQAEAIDQLNLWGGKPLPIAASAWHDGVLHVRLSGATAAVCAARDSLGGEVVDNSHAAQQWAALREQTHPFFTPAREAGRALWRIAVPPVVKPLDLPGEQLVEWGGGQRWWLAPDDRAATADHVRAIAQAAGGHATLFRNGDKSVGVFTPLSSPLAAIHKRLKATFDPAGIFNPQRMYTGL